MFWPAPIVEPCITIHPWSVESVGPTFMQTGGTALNSVASSLFLPAANNIFYIPFYLTKPVLFVDGWWYNGTALSGNADLGIYTIDGAKIVSSGSVATAGASALQAAGLADTQVGPGSFYMALTASDAGTQTFFRGVWGQVLAAPAAGVFEEAAGGFGLPATATFASATTNYLPVFGLSLRTLV